MNGVRSVRRAEWRPGRLGCTCFASAGIPHNVGRAEAQDRVPVSAFYELEDPAYKLDQVGVLDS
jgi:hypothetical protein